MDGTEFNYNGNKTSAMDMQYGILGMESTWGKNTSPRYEPKYHAKMLNSYKTKEWIPTPAERQIIKERGFTEATKQFSTSRGPYQILPETAYRYTSFKGKPEDLEGEAGKEVYFELLKRNYEKSGGNTKEFVRLWNQNPAYYTKLMNLIRAKNVAGK